MFILLHTRHNVLMIYGAPDENNLIPCTVPGLLSVGGERRSLICASLSPSTHWTSRVRSRGQLDVQSAETAAQEQPDSFNTRRPGSYNRIFHH